MKWFGSLAAGAIGQPAAAFALVLALCGGCAAHPTRGVATAQAPAPVLMTPDDALLAAHDAARNGDRDLLASLAPRLSGHLLEPYYEYWKISLKVRTGEDDGSGARAFIQRYPDTFVADRLRADWLLTLGAHGDFAGVQAQMHDLVWNRDDAQVRCYSMLADYALDAGGRRDEFARDARRYLAASADPSGDGCTALSNRLMDDGRLSIWERLRVQLGHGQTAAARDSLGRLDPATQAQARQALERPGAWLGAHERDLASLHHELAILAIAQLAREDTPRAAELADKLEPNLSPPQRGILWTRMGEIATMRLLPEASHWFERAGVELAREGGFSRPSETFEWQARAALRAQGGPDWAALRDAMARMSVEQQREPVWVYWSARVRLARGDVTGAQTQFDSIAGPFGFYPRLAAEELGRPLQLPAVPVPVTEEDIAAMEHRIGFTRAVKLFRLGLRDEGNHEWGWQLRGMTDRELRAAAEFARREGLLDRMIATSDRTRTEIDLTQRYPTPYRTTVDALGRSVGIDPAWIYGLIRQESRFVEDAHSVSGAQGLMQLLPRTAGYVARRIGFADYHPSRITETEVNLLLGASYMKMVYDDQGAEPLLASAAYNAGPRRLRQWRQTLAQPMDGPAFVESIPIHQTRDYVQKVLVNTMIYAAVDGRPHADLKSMLSPVSSRMPADTELP